jgi:hypothetical protein
MLNNVSKLSHYVELVVIVVGPEFRVAEVRVV